MDNDPESDLVSPTLFEENAAFWQLGETILALFYHTRWQ